MKAVSLALRIVALALSVAAAVVMATVCQPIDIFGHAVSYSGYGPLLYFVVASAISAAFAALALYMSVYDDADSGCLSGYDEGTLEMAVSVADAAAQALLFSAAGAVIALRGVIECRGPAGAFCGKVGMAAAIGVSAAVASAIAALTRDAGGSSSSSSDGC